MASHIYVNPRILPEDTLEPVRQEAIHARHRNFEGRIRDRSTQLITISECRYLQSVGVRARRERRPAPY